MDFTLKIFYTVANLKSFSKASELLYLTQPTISFHIKKIENEFGIQVFDRKGNKIYLTEAGKMLYDYAEQVFIEYDRIKEKLSETFNYSRGIIKVGVASLVSQYMFPEILSKFKKASPDINVVMLIGDSLELINKLQKEEIDLAIISEPFSLKNYNVFHFFDDLIVPIVNKDHEWADKKSIIIDDLFSRPIVFREDGSGGRKIFEKYLRQNRFNPKLLDISFTLGSTEAIKAAVVKGMGYGMVSRMAIQDEIDNDILKIVNVKNMEITRKFLIVFSPEKQKNTLFKTFLDFLMEFSKKYLSNDNILKSYNQGIF